MQPNHSTNSDFYDSNPWRNLSDSAFGSSQNSFTGSTPRDSLTHSSVELGKSTQSPARSVYRTYLSKGPPFSRPSSSLSRQSSVSNLAAEGSKGKVEAEKVAQLIFHVKDLSEKFTKLNETVNYLLTSLTESLDQKFTKSSEESQRYIKSLFENVAQEVQVSASERARIAELENVIKEKNQQILNLENKVNISQRLEIESAMSSLKSTISSELQTHLTLIHQMTIQMVKQSSCSKLDLDCQIERIFASIKDVIVNEIDNNFKKHLLDFHKKDMTVGRSSIQQNTAPVKTSKKARPPFDNIFEVREEFERFTPSLNSRTSVSHGTPAKFRTKAPLPSSRTSTKMTMPKQLKSIKHSRHPRSLINGSSGATPVTWSYRGPCSSIQPSEISFGSENCDSISEGSSPSYSISVKSLHKESPNVAIFDQFRSGLTF